MKGKETFTKGDDGEIIWNADGKDIYYQGTTNKELPVTTKISYEHDGKKITAKEAAGATGHLKITFNYTNNISETRVVNGRNVTLYEPFMVISGLLLDNTKAAGVTVSNGKVINTGDRTAVVGMAMPGLKESLDLNGCFADIDIPESVVIEADVTDFSLMTAMTIIENSLLKDVELDDVDTLDELESALGQLTSASGELTDGSQKLYDGVGKLDNGASDLKDGVDKLDKGAGALKDGNDQLASGAKELADGSKTLDTGAGDLKDGASQVSKGASNLASGTSELAKGTKDAEAGGEVLNKGATDLSDGVKQVSDGAAAAAKGASDLSDGASQVSTGAEAVNKGASDLSDGATQVAAGASSLLLAQALRVCLMA